MGRHSLGEKKAVSEIDTLRQKTIEKFFDLSAAVFDHIKLSLKAELVCSACRQDENGIHMPGKARDVEGKCAFCHGAYLVPDMDQRNWAVNEISERVAPKPKAMELAVDQNQVQDEMEKKVAGLSKEDLETLVTLLDGKNKDSASN